ncbi:unnamed protein product [Candida verbasci]|uniref:BSD domain-containing protein n=1 Tax=Candida verbasci TaxID=1227364 RepID=A0A9W4TYW7_9ASCO|nr:unnamed protein product [Candida verbasci]
MNKIKESLQSLLSSFKARIDSPTPKDNSPTPAPGQTSLSDSNLLKNFELQQKLLMENKNLRDTFQKSVMQFKLSPQMFWSSRLNQLRTYALTLSQHKGPYNVLSTIKPIATAENTVNVQVTREVINQIFDIYPITKTAFQELVPSRLTEGEFWSRFFNSKLFRRLRGDKIDSSRGDAILDKYLFMESDTKRRKIENKVLDLEGNEVDNSQKLGNKPDFTMKENVNDLMRNLNKLSETLVHTTDNEQEEPESLQEEELDLHDLEEVQDFNYIKLNIKVNDHVDNKKIENVEELKQYLDSQLISNYDLTQTYQNKETDIENTNNEITYLLKTNYKNFKSINKDSQNIIPNSIIQEIITYNITIVEFLSHFWQLFQSGSNSNQLKKIYVSLKNCLKSLQDLKEKDMRELNEIELVKNNEKLKDKIYKELINCIDPMESPLTKAIQVYEGAIVVE